MTHMPPCLFAHTLLLTLCRFPTEANDGANAGLGLARSILEPIKAKHPWISYADLWTLAGAVAIESMGGKQLCMQYGVSRVKCVGAPRGGGTPGVCIKEGGQ